jgi:hypothetical protein
MRVSEPRFRYRRIRVLALICVNTADVNTSNSSIELCPPPKPSFYRRAHLIHSMDIHLDTDTTEWVHVPRAFDSRFPNPTRHRSEHAFNPTGESA